MDTPYLPATHLHLGNYGTQIRLQCYYWQFVHTADKSSLGRVILRFIEWEENLSQRFSILSHLQKFQSTFVSSKNLR